jgi:hypothetical protein
MRARKTQFKTPPRPGRSSAGAEPRQVQTLAGLSIWARKRCQTLLGHTCEVHWFEGEDVAFATMKGAPRLYVSARLVRQGHPHAMAMTRALIMHELGHWLWDLRDPLFQDVHAATQEAGVGPLFNALLDERLERRLRSRDAALGVALQRVCSWVFLRLAAEDRKAAAAGPGAEPRSIQLWLRALRLGWGPERRGTPSDVAEALRLCQVDLAAQDLRGLQSLSLRLAECFQATAPSSPAGAGQDTRQQRGPGARPGACGGAQQNLVFDSRTGRRINQTALDRAVQSAVSNRLGKAARQAVLGRRRRRERLSDEILARGVSLFPRLTLAAAGPQPPPPVDRSLRVAQAEACLAKDLRRLSGPGRHPETEGLLRGSRLERPGIRCLALGTPPLFRARFGQAGQSDVLVYLLVSHCLCIEYGRRELTEQLLRSLVLAGRAAGVAFECFSYAGDPDTGILRLECLTGRPGALPVALGQLSGVGVSPLPVAHLVHRLCNSTARQRHLWLLAHGGSGCVPFRAGPHLARLRRAGGHPATILLDGYADDDWNPQLDLRGQQDLVKILTRLAEWVRGLGTGA